MTTTLATRMLTGAVGLVMIGMTLTGCAVLGGAAVGAGGWRGSASSRPRRSGTKKIA